MFYTVWMKSTVWAQVQAGASFEGGWGASKQEGPGSSPESTDFKLYEKLHMSEYAIGIYLDKQKSFWLR